jgi:hypothetical protein
MNYYDCCFCPRREVARYPVRVGPFKGHACDLCIDEAALALARFSKRRCEVKPLKLKEAV